MGADRRVNPADLRKVLLSSLCRRCGIWVKSDARRIFLSCKGIWIHVDCRNSMRFFYENPRVWLSEQHGIKLHKKTSDHLISCHIISWPGWDLWRQACFAQDKCCLSGWEMNDWLSSICISDEKTFASFLDFPFALLFTCQFCQGFWLWLIWKTPMNRTR